VNQRLSPILILGLFMAGLLGVPGPLKAESGSGPEVSAVSGEAQITQTIQEGATVQIEYTLTVEGEQVDSSQVRGVPLSYVHGQGQLISGLEARLQGLSIGDERDFTISPEEGYGSVDPAAFVDVPRGQLPPDVAPEVGMTLRGQSAEGRPFAATVSKIEGESVTLDLNHPLAGKTLEMNIEVIDVK